MTTEDLPQCTHWISPKGAAHISARCHRKANGPDGVCKTCAAAIARGKARSEMSAKRHAEESARRSSMRQPAEFERLADIGREATERLADIARLLETRYPQTFKALAWHVDQADTAT